MSRTLLLVCALFAFPAMAQFRSIVPGQSTDAFTVPGEPYFVLWSDHPSPLPDVVAGYTKVGRSDRLAAIGHRYFFDPSEHLYFGYDVVLQPEEKVDTYRVTFYDLSIGPLDFQTESPDSLDPSLWKKTRIPSLPAPQVVHAGDSLSIHVYGDAEVSRELVDTMGIVPMPPLPPRAQDDGRQVWRQVHALLHNGNADPPREAAPVFGRAREFSVEDSEMRLQMSRVTINGAVATQSGGSRVVSGALVWFFATGHGRYILSLSPRPELGFVQAGEVRGSVLSFTIGEDRVLLESPSMIAPGDAPYLLYVLHDPAWRPTGRGQGAGLLFGSVSAREIPAGSPHLP